MQYILTANEFDNLGPLSEIKKWKESAQKLATKLAKEVPRNEYDWKGCVVDDSSDYCDQCPAEEDCPYEYKEYSK